MGVDERYAALALGIARVYVTRILTEESSILVILGQLGEAPEAVGDTLPASVDEIVEEGAKADGVDEMTARLASLRN